MTDSSRINAVAIESKANVYFDGKVVSHTVWLADGQKKTVGLIYPGEYHFNTDLAEDMEIVSGSCLVKRQDDKDWQEYVAGTLFHVRAQSGFDIKVAAGIAEYICSFKKE